MPGAPFLAGCPSALDRAVWIAVSGSVLDGMPWPLPPWAIWTIGVPATAVTAAAIWAWYGRRPNAAIVVAVLAAALHPPLLLSLAPVLTVGVVGARRFEKAGALRLAALALAVFAIIGWLTPHCRLGRSADAATLAGGVVSALRTGIGVIALLLALFEAIRSPRAPHTIAAWLTGAASIAAVVLFQDFDAGITLIPAIVSLWWLAVLAAATIVRTRPALAARSAALVVMVLVPILQAWTLAAVPTAARRHPPTTGRAIASALDGMWKPSALASEDPLHDRFTTMWAAGQRRHGTTLPILTNVSELANGGTRSLYAFAGAAQQLTLRGSLMAPVEAPPSATPILWRLLGSRECTSLTPKWKDITSLISDGQMSGVFERGATGRHAIIYAALPAEPTVNALNWPDPALPGLRTTNFNLSDAASRRDYYRAALADDMPLTLIPSDTAFVARLLLGRIETTSGALAVAFEIVPGKAVARLDPGGNTDRLELCPSAQDLAIVGYPGAPGAAAVDITSPATVGRGWIPRERTGDTTFRWTTGPESEIRFIAAGPARLALTLVINETANGHRRDVAEVLLNGTPAMCEARDSGCTWLLPIGAVRTGLNVITLHADLDADTNPSGGLQVVHAELHSLR